MRCLIDTNVLFSAALIPGSVPDKAFTKACTTPTKAFICDYSFDELNRVFKEKFPKKQDDLKRFIEIAKSGAHVLQVSDTLYNHEVAHLLRDPKDAPILSTAIASNIDIIISGDKDFLILDLEKPKTVSPSDYLVNY
jgi:putative PIN family toxin of toxin-antitoxin system